MTDTPKRQRRPVDGLLLLDKPVGWTSNAALQTVKRLYQAAKAGHTGSLDPLASGLLPICLGAATKLSGWLLNADKSYQFTCRLGITTTTGDAEGEVVAARPVGPLNHAQVEAAMQRFIGVIEQIPPMYSALKRGGQPLYKLARKGIEIEREPRQVTVYAFQLLRWEGEELACELRCSKGTYVRTLATDLGEALGCGAHIAALRRTAVAPYDATRMVTLDRLREQAEQGLAALDALLLPLDTAVTQWPAIRVRGDAAFYLRQGQPVLAPHAPTQGWVRLYEGEHTFLGIGEILDDGRVALRRLLAG
ncbi:MAG: tRNA pseudouridine(55) synthase TruB [Candidatus Competibacteraceae bacterium]|nr:tRNA pseudouridine(55) synthase TruB [Candidatus Competibacteraceae bacterium]HRX71459.1 tRNA pseudouridine(55) synthase TruB [Candidatus Competibacteraceae bacterium]